jgi:hypothetical protein
VPGLGYEYDPFGPIISIPPRPPPNKSRHDSFATNLTEKEKLRNTGVAHSSGLKGEVKEARKASFART